MRTVTDQLKDQLQHHLNQDGVHQAEEVVHTRSQGRGGLLRLATPDERSVVVKFWKLRSLKERVKSILCTSMARREWRMHQLIHRTGLRVPAPMEFGHFTLSNGICYEIMVIEDLGQTVGGLRYLKELIAEGNEDQLHEFEEDLTRITGSLLRAGIVDVDHQLNNFVVDDSGQIYRIDFECARRSRGSVFSDRDYPEMLARLITSHIHATQPAVSRSERFARKLYDRLGVSREVRAQIQSSVDRKLAQQRDRRGVDVSIALPT